MEGAAASQALTTKAFLRHVDHSFEVEPLKARLC